jgi:hypothetical protein
MRNLANAKSGKVTNNKSEFTPTNKNVNKFMGVTKKMS